MNVFTILTSDVVYMLFFCLVLLLSHIFYSYKILKRLYLICINKMYICVLVCVCACIKL